MFFLFDLGKKSPCAHCYTQTGDNVPVLGDHKTVCIIIMSAVNLGFFKANVQGEKVHDCSLRSWLLQHPWL